MYRLDTKLTIDSFLYLLYNTQPSLSSSEGERRHGVCSTQGGASHSLPVLQDSARLRSTSGQQASYLKYVFVSLSLVKLNAAPLINISVIILNTAKWFPVLFPPPLFFVTTYTLYNGLPYRLVGSSIKTDENLQIPHPRPPRSICF